MCDFGRKTLGQVLGSEEDGEAYAEILSHWDAGILTDEQKDAARPYRHGFGRRPCGSDSEHVDDYQRYLFWRWLSRVAHGNKDCGIIW